MTEEWHAEITNDPSRDFDLCIEVWDGPHHRATIERSPSGELRLTWFPSETEVTVPAVWFAEILQQAESDLPSR